MELGPVLSKLAALTGGEYAKLKGVRDEIFFLKDELSSMNATLIKLSDKDVLDLEEKEWRNQVRELSYDIEDCIDDFMHHVDTPLDPKGFFQKCIHKLKALGARDEIAEKIKKLKDRVDSVSERRKRYRFDSSSTGVTTMDPRLNVLYEDVERLVGVDGARDEVINWLSQGEGEEAKKRKVVAIVGQGGSGKTTLASRVYHTLKDQYDCSAFVSVSQKPDLLKIFCEILRKVGGQQPSHVHEVKDVIEELRTYLLDKRYLIIVDDLWTTSSWDDIRCAFPVNICQSRVITTTRNEVVAIACCADHKEYVYKMKPLSNQDSEKLFFNRIFCSQDDCPPHLKKVSAEILKKCDGLPLAIITIASFLASQGTEVKEHWENIRNSLCGCGSDSTLDRMKQILNLSYLDLSCYLKTCFLYLGSYPEDYSIKRDDLFRRWMAEGFVTNVCGRDVEDVAKGYFNELVNRSLIRPILEDYQDGAKSCRVHDIILDFIRDKCREENFITVMDGSEGMQELQHKIRRLSIHSCGGKDGSIPTTGSLSQVRSLVLFSSSAYVLPFSKFKYVRVLALEFSNDCDDILKDLASICRLLQLRFLQIVVQNINDVRNKPIELPSQIGMLQHLETLEIHCPNPIGIPSDIVDLPCLLHLILPVSSICLLEGIGKMKSLRTLHVYLFSLDNIKALGELTNLRDLHLFAGHDGSESFHEKARCLDVLSSLSLAFHQLESLKMDGWAFSRVPKWIAKLHNLSNLHLHVRGVLMDDDVHILAELPALISLVLQIEKVPIENEILLVYSMAFPVLKYFSFACPTMPCMIFEAGAMPNLQHLALNFNAREWNKQGTAPIGIEHLSRLKDISVDIGGWGATESDRTAAESALRNAIDGDVHPNHPRVQIACSKGMLFIFYYDKENQRKFRGFYNEKSMLV